IQRACIVLVIIQFTEDVFVCHSASLKGTQGSMRQEVSSGRRGESRVGIEEIEKAPIRASGCTQQSQYQRVLLPHSLLLARMRSQTSGCLPQGRPWKDAPQFPAPNASIYIPMLPGTPAQLFYPRQEGSTPDRDAGSAGPQRPSYD